MDHSPPGSSPWEYWRRLPCPPPGDLHNPGIEPTSPESPTSAGRFFNISATWEVPYLSSTYIYHLSSRYCISFSVNKSKLNFVIIHLLFLLFYSLQVFKNKINFVIMEIYFNKCSNIFIFKVLQCLKYDIPILFLMVMPTRCSHKPKENICNASVALILGVSFPIEFLQSSKMHANNIL